MAHSITRSLLVAATLSCLISTNAQAEKVTSHTERQVMIEKVGVPLNPNSVRIDELTNVAKFQFRKPLDLQVTSLGKGQPLKLDPAKKDYLWAIDAKGALHVAPHSRGPNGQENIGHPMLTAGRPMRLAGELNYNAKTKTWVMTNDSGRRGFDISVLPEHLRAAEKLLKTIGVVDTKGRPASLQRTFIQGLVLKSGVTMAEQHPIAKKNSHLQSIGGYILLPKKGLGPESIPAEYRSTKGKLAWAKAAQAKLGIQSHYTAHKKRWGATFGKSSHMREMRAKRAIKVRTSTIAAVKRRSVASPMKTKAKAKVARAR